MDPITALLSAYGINKTTGLGDRMTGLLDNVVNMFRDGAPVEDRNPPSMAAQMIQTQARPDTANRNPMIPLDQAPISTDPMAQGINQDMAGFAQTQKVNPLTEWMNKDTTEPVRDEEVTKILGDANAAVKTLAAEGKTADPDTTALGGLWERMFDGGAFESTLGNEEWRLRKAMILNSMRLNPDSALTAAFATRIKDLRAQRGAKAFADKLEASDKTGKYATIITALRNGDVGPKDVMTLLMKAPTSLEQKMSLFKDNPELARNMAAAGLFGAEPTAQKEWDKGLMELSTKQIAEYSSRATAASDLYRNLQNFSSKLESIGETGPLTERIAALREFGASIGMDVDEKKLTDEQTVRATSAGMVAEQLRMNKGPQTDFDARFTATFIPSLGLTTDANQKIGNYMKSITHMQTIYGDLADEVSLSKPEDVRPQLVEINKMSRNTPAVIQLPDGKWQTFEEYYQNARSMPELRTKSDRELVENWQRLYNKYR